MLSTGRRQSNAEVPGRGSVPGGSVPAIDTHPPAAEAAGKRRRDTAANADVDRRYPGTVRAMTEIPKAAVDLSKFNTALVLPHELRIMDFQAAMQDVYDFFYDMNTHLTGKGLARLDDMLRPANLSGTLSDMLTEALGKHSRALTPNLYPNGHPDLIVRGRYANDTVKAGDDGVEIKSTKKPGGAVDTHGGRDQVLCTWVYETDNDRSRPATERDPLVFREVYIAAVTEADFRRNERGDRGTRTSTLDRAGLLNYRQGWLYKDLEISATRAARRAGPWRAPTR